MSISPDDDTDSTEELDSKYDSEQESDVDIQLDYNVGAPYRVDIDGKVDMKTDGDAEEEEVTEEEVKEKERWWGGRWGGEGGCGWGWWQITSDDWPGRDGKYIGWRCRYHGRWWGNRSTWARRGDERAYTLAKTFGTCHVATYPGKKPMTLHSADPALQSAGVFWDCEASKTSRANANSARCWGSRKQDHSGCGLATAHRVSSWQQSPRDSSLQCPSPRHDMPWCPSLSCHSPWCLTPRCPTPWCLSHRCRSPWCQCHLCPPCWGAPARLGMHGVIQSLHCGRGDGCFVQVSVGCLSCSFPLF